MLIYAFPETSSGHHRGFLVSHEWSRHMFVTQWIWSKQLSVPSNWNVSLYHTVVEDSAIDIEQTELKFACMARMAHSCQSKSCFMTLQCSSIIKRSSIQKEEHESSSIHTDFVPLQSSIIIIIHAPQETYPGTRRRASTHTAILEYFQHHAGTCGANKGI